MATKTKAETYLLTNVELTEEVERLKALYTAERKSLRAEINRGNHLSHQANEAFSLLAASDAERANLQREIDGLRSDAELAAVTNNSKDGRIAYLNSQLYTHGLLQASNRAALYRWRAWWEREGKKRIRPEDITWTYTYATEINEAEAKRLGWTHHTHWWKA